MKTKPDTVDSRKEKLLVGLGGWLILMQIIIICRLITGVYAVFLNPVAWIIINAVLMAVCVALFYCRLMLFRVVYMAAVLLSLIFGIINTISERHFFDAWDILLPVLVNMFLVYGLFISRRVKNTFRGIFYSGVEL